MLKLYNHVLFHFSEKYGTVECVLDTATIFLSFPGFVQVNEGA